MSQQLETLEIALYSFLGFYGGDLDLSEMYSDEEEEEGLDNVDWNQTKYNIGLEYFNFWYKENKEWLDKIGISLSYKGIESPTSYNFTNDKLIVTATFENNYTIAKFQELMLENKDIFQAYLKDNFTPYDGYFPYYDNDFKKWYVEYVQKISSKPAILSALIESLELDLNETRNNATYTVLEKRYEFL